MIICYHETVTMEKSVATAAVAAVLAVEESVMAAVALAVEESVATAVV